MKHLSIGVLGPFQVGHNGEPVAGFASDKVRALLAYLVPSPDRPHRRRALAKLLGPKLTLATGVHLSHIFCGLEPAGWSLPKAHNEQIHL